MDNPSTGPQYQAPARLMTSDANSEFIALQEALAGRYSLQRELGRGGMGVVYLAHEVALDRPVALKLLPAHLTATPGLRERFLREARTAAKLSHPHIVPIYAVDQVRDFVFFAMGYVNGETFKPNFDSGPYAPSVPHVVTPADKAPAPHAALAAARDQARKSVAPAIVIALILVAALAMMIIGYIAYG